ncbi:MAG: hypothetical protein EOO12_09900 [Chitinophagaceae bacterium]|nr:MAG: hypothetical protein EOO12_09900 [Chitinophagaceae bacterium]
MRYPILFGLALLAAACGDKAKTGSEAKPQGTFAGTWTSVLDKDSLPEPGYHDTLRFSNDSAFSIRVYNASGLVQETKGTYRYDTARKALLTFAPSGNGAFFVPQQAHDTLRLLDGEGGQMTIRRIGQ